MHAARPSSAKCVLRGGTLNSTHTRTHWLRAWAGDAYWH